MTVIAIDGTFASGKGTLARRLAAHYNLAYLDTGKLYRAVAHEVMQSGGDPDNADDGEAAAKALDTSLLGNPILKSGPVGAAASRVAVHPGVRAALFEFQRDFAAKGAVLDGRDIGTVICPDADVKIFVDAQPEERASRRHTELLGYGEDITFDTVLAQLKERDHRDANRAKAPLKPAADSHLLDTTGLSIESVFNGAVKICEAVLGAK
jgi:cytidylate kinase